MSKVFISKLAIIPSMACKDRDGGVSEVVSALLMVAVVVALAAIAGSMVFGIGLPEEPRTLVVTATRSGDVITFTNHGGMNVDKVAEIRCWIGGVGQGNKDIELETWAGGDEDVYLEGGGQGCRRRDVC
jgi:flagellin-like protein